MDVTCMHRYDRQIASDAENIQWMRRNNLTSYALLLPILNENKTRCHLMQTKWKQYRTHPEPDPLRHQSMSKWLCLKKIDISTIKRKTTNEWMNEQRHLHLRSKINDSKLRTHTEYDTRSRKLYQFIRFHLISFFTIITTFVRAIKSK